MRPQLEEVLALDRLCLKAPGGGALDISAHRAALEASLPVSEWVVVRRDGVLIAYGYLWPVEPGAWFVGGLAIHPVHRTAPVVAELSQSFLARLRNLGAVTLHSHVLRANAPSLRLHRRLGFVVEQENEQAIAFVAHVDALKAPGWAASAESS